MMDGSGQRLKWRAKSGIAGQRQRTHRIAVIGAVEGDEGTPTGMFARGFQRSLNRFRAAAGEIDLLQSGGKQSDQTARELHLRIEDVFPVDHHMQVALGLAADGGENFGVGVATIGNTDSRYEIEVAFAVARNKPRAFGPFDFETDRVRRSLGEEIKKVRVQSIIHRPSPSTAG